VYTGNKNLNCSYDTQAEFHAMKTVRIVIQESEFWQSRDASIAKNRFMNHDVHQIAVASERILPIPLKLFRIVVLH
jgi:hypothetical protein